MVRNVAGSIVMVALVPGLYGLGVRLSVTVKWDPILLVIWGPRRGEKTGWPNVFHSST